jgi:chorismate-pyruvate lyase
VLLDTVLNSHRLKICGALLLAALFIGIFGAALQAESSASCPAAPAALVSRLEAQLLVETLNAQLLSQQSATLTLEQWCGAHDMARPATIVADRVVGNKEPSAEQRRDLRVDEHEALRYRHVKLRCGSVVLSEADNWYVPGRLTSEMNNLLDTTDAPFGRVVRSLDFRRHTMSATLLSPFLPSGWERMPRERIESLGEPCLPEHVLEHRAILTLPDGTPFSEVVETYTGGVLAMPGGGLRACAS